MEKHYLEKILKAHVYEVAQETPLEPARRLSQRLNNQILLKREDLQSVFSFKLRGAHNKIYHLNEAERRAGVIAASAGNHAQGVALAATKLGIKSLIVMPKTTPSIKVQAVRDLGAKAILHGDFYDEAYLYAVKLAQEKSYTYVHPYDDPEVIAGQGTIAMEILRQHSALLHGVFVPVGGGGLIAGVAAYVKALYPHIKIIGVEPEDAACLHAALKNGRRVILDQVGIFADGVAVRQVGKEPFRIAQKWVDEVILVNTDEICAAIKDIFDDTRSITEPAGALAVAGLKKYCQREGIQDQTWAAIVSGANVNFDRLRHIAERAELGEQREFLFAVTIPEQPGSFKAFCSMIGHISITEFNYRYAQNDLAHVFVGVEISSGEHEKQALLARLQAANYAPVDMSNNEMAKLHVRYMVGGRAQHVDHEILYRFEFPERPGALLHFLNGIGKRWNISLFHYRNHGSAYGRVLMGIQVLPADKNRLRQFLDDLGFAYHEESANPAYQLFLS